MRISDWSSDVCYSDVAEDVAHVGVAGTGVAAAHAVLERGVAVLVVHAALAAVRQHLVRLLALLERLDRPGVARVAVRVVLHRAAAIGLLQLIVAGVAGPAQAFRSEEHTSELQ